MFSKEIGKNLLVYLLLSAAAAFTGGCASGGGEAGLERGWTEERSILDERVMKLIENGEYLMALELADSSIAGGVDDTRMLGQRAFVLGELGRMEESVGAFEEAILKDYEGCENHLNFGIVLMKAGQTGRATTELMVAKRFCSGVSRVVLSRNLAVAYLKLGKREKALAEVKEGLGFDGGERYLLGLKAMLIADSHPARAESLFALSGNPADMPPEFLFQYGILLLGSGRASEAAEVFGRGSEIDPANVEMRLKLAVALERLRRFADAERILADLLDESGLDDVRERLARLLFLTGRFEESLDLFRELPPSPEMLDRVAMCNHALGRLDEALEIEREVLRAKPDWVLAMVNISVILGALGELDEAEAFLERVLIIDPDNFEAKINLERIGNARKGKE